MVLNSKKDLIWNKIPVGIHGTKIVFFVYAIFWDFFENLFSDSELASNFELEFRKVFKSVRFEKNKL